MKNILKSAKEIIITYILSYIIIIIACLLYTLLGYQNLDKFLNTGCLFISLIYYLATIYYLYHKNKQTEPTLPNNKYYPLILLGISLATILNMIIFKITPPQATSTLPIYLAILSSGIIGPIYEEILFRYLLYNRLKKFYSIRTSTLITTIIFAIIHLNPIKIIYAFIISLVLTTTYEKEKNILAPILIHIAANSIVIFLSAYNTYILLLSTICLLISIKLLSHKSLTINPQISKKMKK